MISINTEKELVVKSLFSEYQLLRESSEENYEFINGEIIKMYSPSTSHQDVVLNLTMELKEFFRGSNYKIMIAPYDVYLEKEICVIPDISIMRHKSGFTEKRYYGVPTVIVEVVGFNWAKDMIKKLKLYEEFGVQEYWIVDPNSKSFIVYSYDVEKCSYNHVPQKNDELYSRLFSNLKINMQEIFKSKV